MNEPSIPHRSRREFLRGESARAALEYLLDHSPGSNDAPVSPPADLPPSPTSGYVLQLERRAMACLFQIYLNAGQYPGGEAIALECLDLVGTLEEQLSIYKPNSEVSQLNRTGHNAPVILESRLFYLLVLAQQISVATAGAFDITAGPLSHAWGFSRRAGHIPTPEALRTALSRVGSHQLGFNPDLFSVQFGLPDMEVNLGAIGKGYALDRCREILLAAGIEDFLLHGGQSSVLAHGLRDGRQDGWCVGIRHPQRPDITLLEILLKDRALGTSGSATQNFYFAGKRYGHILDPRTGQPADHDLYSVSAMAPTAAEADALATAFFVLGPSGIRDYCAQHAEIGALLVRPTPQTGLVQIEAYGNITADAVRMRHPAAHLRLIDAPPSAEASL